MVKKNKILFLWIILLLLIVSTVGQSEGQEKEKREWIYEAEDLATGVTAIGVKDKDALNGVALKGEVQTREVWDYITKGPNSTDQPPGRYRAIFRMKVASNTSEKVVAELSVSLAWAVTLGKLEVKGTDFEKSQNYQDFTIPFTKPSTEEWLDLRIHWLRERPDTSKAITDMWVDRITIVQDEKFSEEYIKDKYPESLPRSGELVDDDILRIMTVRGLYHGFYHISDAIKDLGAEEVLGGYDRVGGYDGHSLIKSKGIDLSWPFAELLKMDAIVLLNVDAGALGGTRRATLRDYVRNGGGLIVLGGLWSFGKGRYGGTALEEVLPVKTSGPWDIKSFPNSIVLSPGLPHKVTSGLSWAQKPSVMYYHYLVPKPDSEIVIQTASGMQGIAPPLMHGSDASLEIHSGGDPLLVLGTYGKGRVVAFGVTPLGTSPKEGIAFWDWSDWGNLMKNVIKWVSGKE